jgi:hypothetical protein
MTDLQIEVAFRFCEITGTTCPFYWNKYEASIRCLLLNFLLAVGASIHCYAQFADSLAADSGERVLRGSFPRNVAVYGCARHG